MVQPPTGQPPIVQPHWILDYRVTPHRTPLISHMTTSIPRNETVEDAVEAYCRQRIKRSFRVSVDTGLKCVHYATPSSLIPSRPPGGLGLSQHTTIIVLSSAPAILPIYSLSARPASVVLERACISSRETDSSICRSHAQQHISDHFRGLMCFFSSSRRHDLLV